MAIITLSRGTFSGARALAQTISTRVGYNLVSREDLIDVVAGYGVSEARLARARGRRLGLLPAWTWSGCTTWSTPG